MMSEIFIVGSKLLASELLGGYLDSRLSRCQVNNLEKLSDFHPTSDGNEVEQTLLLCDGKSCCSDAFFDELHNSPLHHSRQPRSLFYNLERDIQLEIKLLQRGAQGLVFSDDKPETLVCAIDKILSGQLWASRQALGECLRSASRGNPELHEPLSDSLTRREWQILKLIVDGFSNTGIAARLSLSRHTVKNHLYNIYRKIDVPNRTRAAGWAHRQLYPE